MDYIKTCKEVILRPSDFFRSMPTTGGYVDPLIFASISHIINVLLFTLVRYGMFTYGIRPSLLTLGVMQGSRFNFSIFSNIIEPLFIGIVGTFFLALIYNSLYEARGGTGSYEGTVRFMCYSSALGVLTWIPILGLIAGIYAIYVNIVGGKIVHNVSMRESMVIIFLPSIILLIIVFALLFVLLAIGRVLNAL
jgi:hypothetical protein